MQPGLPPTPAVKSVVTYFPTGPVGRVFFPLLFLGAFFLTLWAGVMALRVVHLRCDRAPGTCSIVSSWGSLSSITAVPIDSIRTTRLQAVSGKHGALSYRVVLVTSGGDVEISGATASSLQRSQEKAQIDRFLADKKATTLDVDYDEPGAGGVAVMAFALIWLVVAWALLQFARIEVDRSTRLLSIVLVRWPLPPKRRSFELGAVRDAIVTEGRGRKGGTVYSVGLVVAGQEAPVPIMNMQSSGRRSKDRAAAEIRALLGWSQERQGG